ncbi:hypothetical protein C8N46_10140 [Kordia periserrulae]|uniref:Uncharacterized protein n=1 Tax=Kordia periserrulae TaxID=701523 RepID=A0A2T6C540_9FLAO|nr:hypothetical protein C8N46_10140 [Kordia periserrulae]
MNSKENIGTFSNYQIVTLKNVTSSIFLKEKCIEKDYETKKKQQPKAKSKNK